MVRLKFALATAALCLGTLSATAADAASAWAMALIPSAPASGSASTAWCMALATGPNNCDCGCGPHKSCQCVPPCECQNCAGDYRGAAQKALAAGKRLVVFVGEDRREVKGAVSCVQAEFHGVKSGVVVGIPDGQGGLYRVDLKPGATDSQISAAKVELPPAPVVTPRVQYLAPPMPFAVTGFCPGGNCSSGR